jgi:hypothetical protein
MRSRDELLDLAPARRASPFDGGTAGLRHKVEP